MTRYVEKLIKLTRQPSRELKALQAKWPPNEIATEKQGIEERIPDDDPLRLSIDLLTPLRRVRDENIHTLALSFLLKPGASHGFDNAVLNSILAEAGYGTGAGKILRLARQARSKIVVYPEYRYRVEGFRNRSLARCDIWIEVRSGKHSALIIIENKIDAPEGKQQLEWYEAQAAKWCKSQKGKCILIFLTADDRQTKSSAEEKWVCLSYLRLAGALRKVLKANPKAPGCAWLELYIATLMKAVLGFSLNEANYHAPITDIKTYLGDKK